MEERKFKENDYVVVKPWDKLVEEFGLIDPEIVRQNMRDDEDCFWTDEEINEYNPEIVNVPWGARKEMIDALVTLGLMKVKGYSEDGSVILETSQLIPDIIPEEILTLVSEDEVKNYIFWINKGNDREDFEPVNVHKYELMEDVFDGVVGIIKMIRLIDNEGDYDVLSYFYLASILRNINLQSNSNFLRETRDVHVVINNYCNRYDKSRFMVRFKDENYSLEGNYLQEWTDKGWVEVELTNDNVEKALYHPTCKGIVVLINKTRKECEMNFNFYQDLYKIINEVHGGTMTEFLELVEKRDRTTLLKELAKIFTEKNEEYKQIKTRLEIENFLEMAKQGESVRLRAIVEDVKQHLEDEERSYRAWLKKYREAQEELFGYLHMQEDSASETIKEMLDMLGDDLKDFKCDRSENSFSFSIVQPLLYWDDSVYERLEDDEYFEDEVGTTYKKVMDKIFKTREYIVYFKQGVKINLNSCSIQNYSASDHNEYIPNPHIENFNCWGNNKPNIMEAITNRDYVNVFNLVRSAIAGIALYDDAVVREFNNFALEVYDENKCIKVKETGEMISFTEALEREE